MWLHQMAMHVAAADAVVAGRGTFRPVVSTNTASSGRPGAINLQFPLFFLLSGRSFELEVGASCLNGGPLSVASVYQVFRLVPVPTAPCSLDTVRRCPLVGR